MTAHPEPARIELFVLGALDEAESVLFTDHVAACDLCSAKLAEEAKLELSLLELPKNRSAAAAPRPRRPRPRSAFVALGFAAAAAVTALWIGRGALTAKRDAVAVAPRPVASCPDGIGQLDCIAEAHRDGRVLEYPGAGKSPLAALGTEPGLSVLIEAGAPVPPMPEFADAVATLRPAIEACIERNLTTQSKPIITGQYVTQTEIAADGVVVSANTLVIVHGPRAGAEVWPTTTCFEGYWKARRFPAVGHTTRAETTIKFVWRE
jgi:hypothetical protein